MNTFRFVAIMAAFVASPVQAATCYDQTVAAMGSLWRDDGGNPMTPAGIKSGIEQTGGELLVQRVSPKVEESCRQFVADNARAYAGLGQPVEPPVEAAKMPVTETVDVPVKTEAKPLEEPVTNVAAAKAESQAAAKELPAQVNLSKVYQNAVNVQSRKTALQQVPVKELSDEELAFVQAAAGIDDIVLKLQALKESGTVETATLPKGLKEAIDKVNKLTDQAEAIEGIQLQLYGVYIVLLLLTILATVGWYRRGKKDAKLEHRLVAVEQSTKDLKDTVPTEIRLELFWKDLLRKGGQQTLDVEFDGKPYNFVVAELVENDMVRCTAGLLDHNPDNLIALENFESSVRKAGYYKDPKTGKNRLTEELGKLKKVA